MTTDAARDGKGSQDCANDRAAAVRDAPHQNSAQYAGQGLREDTEVGAISDRLVTGDSKGSTHCQRL